MRPRGAGPKGLGARRARRLRRLAGAPISLAAAWVAAVAKWVRPAAALILAAGTLSLLAAALGRSAEAAAARPRVFIETEVNPTDPYVQAAARVTVRVYSARALYHPDLDLPASADVLVRQVGPDERGTAKRAGRSYEVITRQYLVFPQHSGKLGLSGAVLSAQVLSSAGRPDLFYGPGGPSTSPYGYGAMVAVEPLQLRGDAIALEVRPRPAGAVSSYWVPASEVTLTSAWHPALQAHVGDAFTLDLTVQADGLTAEQLPDLSTLVTVPPGLKAYPDEPKLDNSTQGDTLVGRREQSIALIADQPGRFTLPALRLQWWDTVRDVAQQVVVPARMIVVSPSQGAAAPAGPVRRAVRSSAGAVSPGPFNHGDPWLWASIALALAWLATLGGWSASARRRRPRPPLAEPANAPSAGASGARAAFLKACRENDPRAARRHLLAWVEAMEAGRVASPPTGLNRLGRRIGNPEIERLLRELDRACYAGGAWRGDALAGALCELPAPTKRPSDGESRLEPLYR